MPMGDESPPRCSASSGMDLPIQTDIPCCRLQSRGEGPRSRTTTESEDALGDFASHQQPGRRLGDHHVYGFEPPRTLSSSQPFTG